MDEYTNKKSAEWKKLSYEAIREGSIDFGCKSGP